MRPTKCLQATLLVALPPGLRRLLQAPAGRWWIPTLSPRSVCRRLDPYPAAPLQECPLYSCRASAFAQLGGARRTDYPRDVTSTRGLVTRLQPFAYVQAPTLARPPGHAYRWTVPEQLGRIHRAMNEESPTSSCGIATCPNRAIDMAGLPPARPRPCRPLHQAPKFLRQDSLPTQQVDTCRIRRWARGRREYSN